MRYFVLDFTLLGFISGLSEISVHVNSSLRGEKHSTIKQSTPLTMCNMFCFRKAMGMFFFIHKNN